MYQVVNKTFFILGQFFTFLFVTNVFDSDSASNFDGIDKFTKVGYTGFKVAYQNELPAYYEKGLAP